MESIFQKLQNLDLDRIFAGSEFLRNMLKNWLVKTNFTKYIYFEIGWHSEKLQGSRDVLCTKSYLKNL